MNTVRSALIFISIFLLGWFNSFSAPIQVSARLDSVNLLMGNLMTLHLEVVQNEGTKGQFKIFSNIDSSRGFVPVCGDSVELRTDYTVDTSSLGSGKIQLNYSVPVQAFDSGTYTLPQFVYISGNDSAASNHLTFNVVPVNVTAEDEISPFAPVAEPDGKKFYDWVPDWIIDFWWVFIIIVLAICLLLWAMNKYKKGGLPQILSRPVISPWDEALSALSNLKERKLWEQGMEKEYFTELTDILRVYLFKRFGINAMEMTTRQIMDIIYASDFKDKKDYVRQILNVADFVKFAKVRPLPADSISAYDNAVKFVKETIPQESDNAKDKNNSLVAEEKVNSEEGGKER